MTHCTSILTAKSDIRISRNVACDGVVKQQSQRCIHKTKKYQ